MKRVVAIIQARMGSTRLPGKVLKTLKGRSVLAHVVDRVRQSKYVNDIVIATTNLQKDNVLIEEIKKMGIKYFRGSEWDVLSRYYYAAKENNADIIVRITSDCPLIDSKVVDDIIKFYLDNNYELVTNAGMDLSKRTYPRGLDVEVFSFNVLEKVYNNANRNYQREHVTPYIYENIDNIYYYLNKKDYSKYRWTLDTIEDFKLISRIYDEFYTGDHDFYLDEIIEFMNKNPEISKINEHIEQKKIK
ncbi:cytidylyltransferase domain-containing protein [Tepidibacter thalassicus]|uniref:Spore coat polysaccharide biosynthesis protein SpsF n=1 Tax=Tepidibacter thalassicus DSM 15285 TaxID=1123350 RepID=A0A1M5R4T4_9FIRM|nr:glycosyltransferase family protein [Tepidibacter thalassicus]SHH20783.1 spore coat polysaccharide biosynthesis protein SpsF [Tepidibacter thalassicus DSM 15285]